MTSLMTLSNGTGRKLKFLKRTVFWRSLSLNNGTKYTCIYVFSQQDADHMLGDYAHTFLSHMGARASGQTDSFIFVAQFVINKELFL